MFSITSFLSLALAASSVVGFAIPVQHRSLHRRWYSSNGEILEKYEIYHSRYLRLDCEHQHNTTFFAQCCHPFLKTQGESMLPATCAAPSPSASAPTATATDADVDATPTGTDADVDATPTATDVDADAAPTSTSGSDSSLDDVTGTSDDDGEYCTEGDADCDCEDEDDSSSSTATADAASAPTGASNNAGGDDSSDSAAANAGGDPNAATSTFTQDATSTVYSAPTADSSSSSSSSSSSDSGAITDGVATFFYQNGVAGACGTVHPDSALIAAMDTARYGNGELCGKQVHITNSVNGKSVVVTVADECPTCNNGDSIDLSTGAFDQIADESTGEVSISWYFV